MNAPKPHFKVGDIVTAKTKPNCIQRVEKVFLASGAHFHLVTTVVLWRLDDDPPSTKPTKPVYEGTLQLADKAMLLRAVDRLKELAESL